MTSPFLDLLDQLVNNLPSYLLALGSLVATLVLANLAKRAIERNLKNQVDDPETRQLLGRITRWTVLILGIMTSLNQIPGVDVTSLLAGLGIAGFTIGFALQDIARNFIAGLLILVRQPFSVGDGVQVAGHEGTVMDITARDTVIKSWDGVMEIIPNLDVYSNPIVNYSELPLRRRTVMIGLGYGEDVDQARAVFLDVIENTEGVQAEPAPEILTEELGSATLNMAARFWVDQTTHNLLGVHSDIVDAINEAAEREGIDLPYPIQVVQLEAELPVEIPLG